MALPEEALFRFLKIAVNKVQSKRLQEPGEYGIVAIVFFSYRTMDLTS
jgi:hypothetical protein